MIINEISVKQYGSYKGENTVYLKEGTTGIIGTHDANNLRSNGNGKSTLVRSINFAIYGKDEGKKIESAVNDTVPANEIDMWVKTKFNHGGINYIITRGRKKTSPYLYFAKIENDTEVEIGDEETDIRKKQILINDIIGMDFEMFTATVFFEQRKADKFINTESSKSQEYLDSVLNLDMFRAAIKLAASKSNKVLDLFKTTKSSVDSTTINISSIEKEILTKDSLFKAIAENNDKLNNCNKMLNDLTEQAKSFEAVDEILKKLSSVTGKIKSVSDSITSNKAKIILNHKKIKDANNLVAESNKTITFEEGNIKVLSPKVSILKDEIASSRKVISDCVALRSKNLAEKTQAATLLSNIDVPKCSCCQQDISEAYRETTIKFIKDQVERIDALIEDVNKKEALEVLNLRSAEKELLLTESTIQSSTTAITNAKSKIEYNMSVSKDVTKEIVDIEASIKLNESLIIDLEKEQGELQTKVEYAQNLNIEGIKTQIKVQTTTIYAIKAEIENLTRQLGILDEKEHNCEDLKVKLIELKQSMAAAEDNIDTYTIVSTIFKKMIDEMFMRSVKLIEYHANNLIQQVYPNFRISIYKDKTKKLEPLVFDFICDGRSREYDRLSGGQKTVADICLRLGFSKTLMDISNTKINFICLDEPFESLDEYNRELIKQILMFESKTFSQIIIISHTPDARDFEHTIHVRMSADNISYIS